VLTRVRFIALSATGLLAACNGGGARSAGPSSQQAQSGARKVSSVGQSTPRLRLKINKRGDVRVEHEGKIVAIVTMPTTSAPTPAGRHPLRAIVRGELKVPMTPQKSRLTSHHTLVITQPRHGKQYWRLHIRPLVRRGQQVKPAAVPGAAQSSASAR
jgi:hypothetical protein